MWSNFLRPTTIFPAKFWTTYRFLMFDFEVFPQTVEQLKGFISEYTGINYKK